MIIEATDIVAVPPAAPIELEVRSKDAIVSDLGSRNRCSQHGCRDVSHLTPLRWKVFATFLKDHPDQDMVQQLVHDLQYGVQIGYTGPRDAYRPSPNLPIDPEHESFVDEEIAKEVALGRRMGPFDSPPFKNLIVSPIGVVTKKLSSKLRLIHHLSWPRSASATSVNNCISQEDSETVLASFDDAVSMLAEIPVNEIKRRKPIMLSKIDVKSAYRLVPVREEDWHCLGMMWRGKYYYDAVLVFGLASACQLWERVATAIHWIATSKLGLRLLVHYIDDYLLISVGTRLAEIQLRSMLKLFDMLGVPISIDKLEGPSESLPFLGIQIHSSTMTIALDKARLAYVQKLLSDWMSLSKVTIKEVQSLIGTLSFCCKVIRAGRVFLRRLINYVTHLLHRNKNLVRIATAKFSLPDSVKKDILWWSTFIQQFNGTMSIYPTSWCTDTEMRIATDACVQGYGATFGNEWLFGQWTAEEEQEAKRDSRDSMPWKELYCLVKAASTWGHKWSKHNIIFHLDCEPMVYAVNKGGSKHPSIMSLLRTLSYIAITNNFHYKVVHIPGHTNIGPDLLSRNHILSFQSQFPNSNPSPTPPCPIPCSTW